VALTTTHSADNLITDSAAAGTALATGYKTYNNGIGVDADTTAHPSILERAEEAGLATGLVATYAVTHATPAAFYAHTANRYYQYDIAEQLVDKGVEVIIAGGAKHFESRKDGRNLSDSLRTRGYVVAHSLDEVADIDGGKVAVFAAHDAMPGALNNRGSFLPDATAKALEILSKSRKGFFIMIEGSQIDGQAHGNNIEGVVAETSDFDKAVEIAFNFADTHKDTLVVVGADHETGGLSTINPNGDFSTRKNPVDYAFTAGGHSGGMTPLYTYGAGAKEFYGVLDNTDVPRIIARLMGLEW
jgi:alkaline phosphatase